MPKKFHEKLIVRGGGVNAYGQPDRKISAFLRLPLAFYANFGWVILSPGDFVLIVDIFTRLRIHGLHKSFKVKTQEKNTQTPPP